MLSSPGLAADRIVFKAKVIIIVAREKCKLQNLEKEKKPKYTKRYKHTNCFQGQDYCLSQGNSNCKLHTWIAAEDDNEYFD